MPTTDNPRLTLTKEVGTTNIIIEVTYDVTFNRLERNLAQLGMNFRDVVEAIGVDPPGSTTGILLLRVGTGNLDVPAVNSSAILHRKHTVTVSRELLNEDPGTIPNTVIKDDDEIRCRIQFLTSGFPFASSETFTNQVILFEDAGNQPIGQSAQVTG
jgi:hypothetical protein